MIVDGNKSCAKCSLSKSISEFGKDVTSPDGLKYTCRSCMKSKAIQRIPVPYKTCRQCGIEKNYYEFYLTKWSSDGLSAYCMECDRINGSDYRERNTEKHRASSRNYYWNTHDSALRITRSSWYSMNQRCHNPEHKAYKDYGAVGIYVCPRWRDSLENFIEDMGFRPATVYQIDRIDGTGGYDPDNCRWVTVKDQQRNRKDNVILELNGKSQCISAWAEELGIKAGPLYARAKSGLSAEDVILVPIAKRTKR